MKKQKYLTNANILAAIHESKMSFCSILAPEYKDYDLITHDILGITFDVIEKGRETRANRINTETIKKIAQDKEISIKRAREYCEEHGLIISVDNVFASEVVVRVMTNEHVPDVTNKKGEIIKQRTNFKPFKHYVMWDDGELVEVARSHWKGSFDDGEFCTTHGKLTDELGKIIIKFTERYSYKANYRGYSYLDDMVGDARLVLTVKALLFDESIQTVQLNPFAYYTSIVNNAFRAVLNTEKYHRNIRDKLLVQSGFDPSFTKQIEDGNE